MSSPRAVFSYLHDGLPVQERCALFEILKGKERGVKVGILKMRKLQGRGKKEDWAKKPGGGVELREVRGKLGVTQSIVTITNIERG